MEVWRKKLSKVKLVHSDCIEYMKEMEEGAVHLTVTSPPYDNQRDYKGNSAFPFSKFEECAQQLYRVTSDGGVLVWVVADQTVDGSETGTSFKQALYFKEVGFRLHDTMIFNRDAPPLTHNRYEQSFEYMFILSKGKPRVFNPIMVPKSNMQKAGGKTKYGRRDPGNTFDEGVYSDKKEKIKGNIWKYTVGSSTAKDKVAFGHPALFPEGLATDHILSWSNKGDVIFDPFMGSGTTGKSAYLNDRDFIGVELEEEYLEIAHKRLSKYGKGLLRRPSDIEIIK